jgi:hypothetical protein
VFPGPSVRTILDAMSRIATVVPPREVIWNATLLPFGATAVTM